MVAVRGGAGRRPARAASRAIWCSSGGSVALGMDESFGGSVELDALEDALAHAGEHLAGADLEEGRRAGLVPGDDGLPPAHGADQGGGELVAHVGERCGARPGEDGEPRLEDLDLVE